MSEDNKLLAWGRSDFGRCGVNAKISWRGEADTVPVWIPQEVPGVDNVSVASAGGFFTVAQLMDDPRKLVTFGGNGNGELGIGKKTKFEWIPQIIDFSSILKQGETLQSLSCGGFHTCVLTSQGRVFAFGDNHSNQLGLHDENGLPPTSSSSPVEMVSLLKASQGEEITSISCGPTYTIACTKSNRVFLVGSTPSARKALLIYQGQRRVSLPDRQGAHHIMVLEDESS